MRLTEILVDVNSKKVVAYMLQIWKMHTPRKISHHLNIYKIFAKDKNNFCLDETEFKFINYIYNFKYHRYYSI